MIHEVIHDQIVGNLKDTIQAYQELSNKQEEIIAKQKIVMAKQSEMIESLKLTVAKLSEKFN